MSNLSIPADQYVSDVGQLHHLYSLDASLKESLQHQIKQQIAQRILSNHIPPGFPLPSTRSLAMQLGISRNTVDLAYNKLVEDGLVVAVERAGYYVSQDSFLGSTLMPAKQELPDIEGSRPNWQQRFKQQPLTEPSMDLDDQQEYEFNFAFAQADSNFFATRHWRECCKDINHIAPAKLDVAGQAIDASYLIEQLRTRILPRRGIWADAEEILITSGSHNGLYLSARLLLDNQSLLGVECPGSAEVVSIASLHAAQVKPLAMDQDGLLVAPEMAACDCVYTTPSYQLPTGVTMTLARRKALLAMANKHDCLVIEDDLECETNFDAKPLPAIKSFDQFGRVIYLGSFTKSLTADLSIGYMVASREFIAKARALRNLISPYVPNYTQHILALFIARGYYDAFALRVAKEYRDKNRVMAKALQEHLPKMFKRVNSGGSSYWLTFPAGVDVKKLQRKASDEGLIFAPQGAFFMMFTSSQHHIRLVYAFISIEKIEPGIRKLAQLIAMSTESDGHHLRSHFMPQVC